MVSLYTFICNFQNDPAWGKGAAIDLIWRDIYDNLITVLCKSINTDNNPLHEDKLEIFHLIWQTVREQIIINKLRESFKSYITRMSLCRFPKLALFY